MIESQMSEYLDQDSDFNPEDQLRISQLKFSKDIVPFEGYENLTKTDYLLRLQHLSTSERVNMLRFNFNLGKNQTLDKSTSGSLKDFD